MKEIMELSVRIAEFGAAIAAVRLENENSPRLPNLTADRSDLIKRLYHLVQRLHRKDELENKLFCQQPPIRNRGLPA